MSPSKLDKFYRGILLSKYFVKGWGDPEGLKRLLKFRKTVSNRDTCYKLVESDYPVTITKDENLSDHRVIEGHFYSPFDKFVPGLLPEESKKAYFQMIVPQTWKHDSFKPVCLHMAGTGDHYFWRRRKFMVNPLLKEHNIGAIMLENPFYGVRKPKDQVRSILHNVSDIFVMGGCLILEALVIFHWCKSQGYGPLGVTGLSMGGHMASLAATNWPEPIIVVPCLSWSTASGVFTKGVMSHAINWSMLASQYNENEILRREIRKMVYNSNQMSSGDEAFKAGQKFAQDFPTSMISMMEDGISVDSAVKSFSKSSKEKEEIMAQRSHFPTQVNIINFLKSKFSVKSGSVIVSNNRELIFYSDEESGVEDLLVQETVNFMRGIMDECTHLKNFSVPVDTSLIISVFAQNDGYVPRDDCTDITVIWPGTEVRVLNAGHVSAFVLYLSVFRTAIADAFERYRNKYIR